jgi:methylase of polypeptide subunit release factors
MTSIGAASKYISALESGQTIVTSATEASALRNREFIGNVLQKYIVGSESVFEVGTGTGVQAVISANDFRM